MIGQAVELVKALREAGMTKGEAVAAKPLADFNRGEGFISADQFVEAIWTSLD